MKFILNEGQIKRLLDENLLSSLLKFGTKNLFKTGIKELPKNFKYLTDVKSLMKPEIKTLISVEKPLIEFSEFTAKKFYDLFWTDTKLIQKELKGITTSNVGLTKDGTKNLIELTQNSNKLESLINTKIGSKLNLKDYVETIYKMKNQADNLVNEILILNPKSPNIQTVKNIQSKVNQVVKKNEDLLKNATPSKAVKKTKPVNKQVSQPQVNTEPVKTQNNAKVNQPKVKPESVKKSTNAKVNQSKVKPEQVTPKGNFKTISIERDNIGIIKNNKAASFIDRLFEKVFYEGFDRRNNMFTKEIVSKLTPETKSYLKQLKDVVESKGFLNGPQMLFKDTYGRLPKTIDEEIEMISGNFWGGYGRRSEVQNKLNEVPVPSSSVIENLMDVTMSPSQKNEVLELYKKMFG